MPGSRGIEVGAGMRVFPASPADRKKTKRAKAQRELTPLLVEVIADLAVEVEASNPSLRGTGASKLSKKVDRLRDLAMRVSGRVVPVAKPAAPSLSASAPVKKTTARGKKKK